MLIFVSDLHLADDRRRTTLDARSLVSSLEHCILSSPREHSESVTLILLGDIFEMLKSDVWLRSDLKPWSADERSLAIATEEVLQRIAQNNPLFFTELRRLGEQTGLRLVYVPGNHDGLLGLPCAAESRKLLRSLLPLEGAAGAPFPEHYPDSDLTYGVWGEHGHAFDSFNTRTTGARFVPGDAVVVELVANLPVQTAKQLGLLPALEGQFSGRLAFLQELDNVRPQDAAGIVNWVDWCLSRDGGEGRNELEQAILKALSECIDSIGRHAHAHGAMSSLVKKTLKPFSWAIRNAGFRAVRSARHLSDALADEMAHARMRIGGIGPLQTDGRQAVDLFVAGHTHLPGQHPMALTGGRMVTYLNTGTWRRVHLQVYGADGSASFHSYYEESLLVVHPRSSSVRYEFRRQARGL